MTYFIQDFGTAANPTLPDIIEINWMNTWDYCNEIANAVGQKFNGTFNLNLKLGATIDGGKYVLTQNPVSAYESLRGEKAVEFKGVQAGSDNDLLSGFSGDCYEIIATFKPASGTKKVGFMLRTGGSEGTEVSYNVTGNELFVDPTNSGKQVGNFADGGRYSLTPNADGTIDLHIFVDRSSVEVSGKGGIAAGANMIFPSANSLGAKVIVDGDPVTADITIYKLNSIWN